MLFDNLIVGSASNEFLVKSVYSSMGTGKGSNSENMTNKDNPEYFMRKYCSSPKTKHPFSTPEDETEPLNVHNCQIVFITLLARRRKGINELYTNIQN